MSERKIYDDELFAHFITFSCYKRRRLLDHDQPKRIVLGVLCEQLQRQSAMCVGFALMPDHVHAIVWFPRTKQLSRFMHGWKRRSSYGIRKWQEQVDFRYLQQTSPKEPVWQSKYYSFEIYSNQKLEEKLRYIHLNPVRAGLAEKAVDWRWSSARWYEQQKSVGVPLGWPR